MQQLKGKDSQPPCGLQISFHHLAVWSEANHNILWFSLCTVNNYHRTGLQDIALPSILNLWVVGLNIRYLHYDS